MDDRGAVQRDDNFGHENICIGLHPTWADVCRASAVAFSFCVAAVSSVSRLRTFSAAVALAFFFSSEEAFASVRAAEIFSNLRLAVFAEAPKRFLSAGVFAFPRALPAAVSRALAIAWKRGKGRPRQAIAIVVRRRIAQKQQ